MNNTGKDRVSFSLDKGKEVYKGSTGVTATSHKQAEPTAGVEVGIIGSELIFNSSQKLFDNIDKLGEKLSSINKPLVVEETAPETSSEDLFAWGKSLMEQEDREVFASVQPEVDLSGERDNFCRGCGRKYATQDNFCGGCGFKRA